MIGIAINAHIQGRAHIGRGLLIPASSFPVTADETRTGDVPSAATVRARVNSEPVV